MEEKEENNITTIKLSKDTRDKLVDLGKKNDTYEDIILKLINSRVNKK